MLSATSRAMHSRCAEGFGDWIYQLGASLPCGDVSSSERYGDLVSLGRFDIKDNNHQGVSLEDNGRTVVKTNNWPDSNNIFVDRRVVEDSCWTQFRVHKTKDELVFGVTDQIKEVAAASGFRNTRLTNTWNFAKQ